MGDDWDNSGGDYTPQTRSEPPQGRTFGSKGRGFVPSVEERRPGGFNRGDRNDRNDGDRSYGGRGGRRNEESNGYGDNENGGDRRNGGGFRGRNNDDNNDWGERRGGGGFKGRNDDDNEDGGGRRGGGGFRGRNDDDNGGERRGGFGRRDQNRDDEDGDRPRRDGEENGAGEENKPKKQTYVPPDPTEDENEMFNSGLACGKNFDKYDSIEVKVSGQGDIPKPIQSFEQSGLRPHIISLIKKSHYTKPTPIQKHAIPLLLSGRDLMACAQTGSGKTAAFLVPIINKLLSDDVELINENGTVSPQVIIVSPTRELTIQIWNEARKFSYETKIKVCVAYGGTAVYNQVQNVMRGCNILVATPGRLMDFVGKGRINFSACQFVVLDEADRMLDMGFMPEMEKLFGHETMAPKDQRQTLMFSATFPDEVQRLAGKFMKDYVFVAVGVIGGACDDVEQRFYEVTKFDKKKKLFDVLKEKGSSRTLVFVEQKRTADLIATWLSEKNFPTTSIHGDREQRQREEALADFKSGRMDVLVATAVAARGLDIKNVHHVINLDLPKSIDEYVHRIGRTGRVGNRGLATSFYCSEYDSALAGDLLRILNQAHQEIPDFLKNATGGSYSRSGFGGSDVRNDSGISNGSAQETYETEEW